MRNRNKICLTCEAYHKGQCRIDPPAVTLIREITVQFPEAETCAEGRAVYRTRFLGCVNLKLSEQGGWPKVNEDDWCAKWIGPTTG